MKIKNLNKVKNSQSLNESLKKRFGYSLNFKNMDIVKAKKVLHNLNEGINKYKSKVGEKAHTNSTWLEKKLVSETLEQYIREKEQAINLERRASLLKQKLHEAQAQEAEVVLAAKDMVDRIQGMIEDLGSMQNEQLQPLVDTVRSTMGDETARSFESSMNSVLTTALDSMRQARIDSDTASRILSGETPPQDDNLMGMDDSGTGDSNGEEELDLSDVASEVEDEPADDIPDTKAGRNKRDNVDLDLSGL